jgi:hypothetical protein
VMKNLLVAGALVQPAEKRFHQAGIFS